MACPSIFQEREKISVRLEELALSTREKYSRVKWILPRKRNRINSFHLNRWNVRENGLLDSQVLYLSMEDDHGEEHGFKLSSLYATSSLSACDAMNKFSKNLGKRKNSDDLPNNVFRIPPECCTNLEAMETLIFFSITGVLHNPRGVVSPDEDLEHTLDYDARDLFRLAQFMGCSELIDILLTLVLPPVGYHGLESINILRSLVFLAEELNSIELMKEVSVLGSTRFHFGGFLGPIAPALDANTLESCMRHCTSKFMYWGTEILPIYVIKKSEVIYVIEFNSKVDADHLRQIVRYKVENFITEISGFSFNFMAKVAGGNDFRDECTHKSNDMNYEDMNRFSGCLTVIHFPRFGLLSPRNDILEIMETSSDKLFCEEIVYSLLSSAAILAFLCSASQEESSEDLFMYKNIAKLLLIVSKNDVGLSGSSATRTQINRFSMEAICKFISEIPEKKRGEIHRKEGAAERDLYSFLKTKFGNPLTERDREVFDNATPKQGHEIIKSVLSSLVEKIDHRRVQALICKQNFNLGPLK